MRKQVIVRQEGRTILGVNVADAFNPLTYVNPLKVAHMAMTAGAHGMKAMVTGKVPITNDVTVSGATTGEVERWMGIDRVEGDMDGSPLHYATRFTSSTPSQEIDRGKTLGASGLIPKVVPAQLRGVVGSSVVVRQDDADGDGNREAHMQLSGRVANGDFSWEATGRRERVTVRERGEVDALPDLLPILNPVRAMVGTVLAGVHLHTVEASNAIESGAKRDGYRVVRK